MAKKKRKQPDKLKWRYSDNDLPFETTWKSESFIIELIEGYGGDDGGDMYMLSYNKRQIEAFSTLAKAKRVAQLIHEQ